MTEQVEGGIRKNQDLVRFEASAVNVPVKDLLDLMMHNWFALTAGRTEPIEYSYTNARSERQETVRITCPHEHGIATIHDQDLLLFVISQWIEARAKGMVSSRRVIFTPYQFFQWIDRTPSGSAYQRFKEALERLKGTNIETSRSIEQGKNRRNMTKRFSWVSEYGLAVENDELRGVEIVLAEWLYEMVHHYHVLTLDPRYFGLTGATERWLYMYAHRSAGKSGVWMESIAKIHRKSASQQDLKHFKSQLMKVIEKNALPGLKLTKVKSKTGEDSLLMEKVKGSPAAAMAPEQIPLFEKSPHEQHWENLLEIMKRRIGEAVYNSWFGPGKVEFRSFEGGKLTLAASMGVIATRIEEMYLPLVRDIWESFGHEVKSVIVTAPPRTLKSA
jgi:plasmid replication initiation protein